MQNNKFIGLPRDIYHIKSLNFNVVFKFIVEYLNIQISIFKKNIFATGNNLALSENTRNMFK